MFDAFNQELDKYFGKWRALIDGRKDPLNKEFFERLKPVTAGWKVADLDEYNRVLGELRGASDHIVEKWMNNRWIAYLHLKDTALSGGIEIFEILQRRPDRDDKLGLDFVDFFCTETTNARAILQEEGDMKWNDEENGGVEWISLWFDGTEAKLKAGTAFDIVQEELREISNKIRGERFTVGHNDNISVSTNAE